MGSAMHTRFQKGFTLIELMIVIAIIGILAAIALPAYQDYTARAQATEAFQVTSGLRSQLGVYATENATLTDAHEDDSVSDVAGNLNGQYIGAVSVEDGEITVTFSAGIHNGDDITITAVNNNGQIAGWTCGGDLAPEHLPGTCQ